ncbi:DUF7219 family protein [Brasilonema octagenarum]|uniref:Uncharacterized protein n=1 Tax=Brasilonema octagenarum UFV-OR1 TaxID=417115 RepID=A0ABX1MAF8_9CYAN|nr:hypothetical protein [Brasilonema octagenarum]NMF63944.1 hypothetical protein [Brasilonema octagenarum UFV-OR1]
MKRQIDKYDFLYQRRSYHGNFTPEALVFNANLQEFATRVGYISNLQTLGKLSPQDANQQITELWERLQQSYSELGIDSNTETKGCM